MFRGCGSLSDDVLEYNSLGKTVIILARGQGSSPSTMFFKAVVGDQKEILDIELK